MRRLIIVLACIFSFSSLAQTKDSNVVHPYIEEEQEVVDYKLEHEDQVYTSVEEMPEFPGGKEAMKKYLKDNMIYPEEGRKQNVEGVVFLQITADKQGLLNDIIVIKGISPLFDAEATRLIKEMPAWKPGKKDGKTVNVKYVIPIKFKLEKEE